MSEYGVSRSFDPGSIWVQGKIDGLRDAGYKYPNDSTCRLVTNPFEGSGTSVSRKKLAMNCGSAVPHFHTCSGPSHNRPKVGRSGYESETE